MAFWPIWHGERVDHTLANMSRSDGPSFTDKQSVLPPGCCYSPPTGRATFKQVFLSLFGSVIVHENTQYLSCDRIHSRWLIELITYSFVAPNRSASSELIASYRGQQWDPCSSELRNCRCLNECRKHGRKYSSLKIQGPIRMLSIPVR